MIGDDHCSAVSHFYNGESHRCAQIANPTSGLCRYHAKMADGLIEPFEIPQTAWAVMDKFPGTAFVTINVTGGEEAIIYVHVTPDPDSEGLYDPAIHGDVERTRGIPVLL